MKNIDKYIVQPNSFLILNNISFWCLGWVLLAKENNCIGLLEVDEQNKSYIYTTISKLQYPFMENYSNKHTMSFISKEKAYQFAESHVEYHNKLLVNIF